MTIATWPDECKIGGVALKASSNVHGSTKTAGTALEVGKGHFRVVVAVTVLDVASGDEHYIVDIEANSRDATTTWRRIGTVLAVGDKATTGRDADDAIGSYETIVDNPYDYQIRCVHYLIGSTAGGITDSITLYPVARKE